MKNQIYGYARVSSKDQNLARQIAALKGSGVKNENIFIDKSSGKDFDRTEYQKLTHILHKGDIVIIKSIDRLGRNYNEIINEWKKITKDLQANIKVTDLPLLDTTKSDQDLTSTFISDIVLQILSYVAEQERENIRQRQAEGIAIAKAQGKYLGRPQIERPSNFDEIYKLWKSKTIGAKEAIKTLNLKKSTFYKFANNVKDCDNHDEIII